MAFGFIKSIVNVIKKIPKPILNVVANKVLPKEVKLTIDTIKTIVKPLKKENIVNPFEKAIREVVDVIDAAINKNGNVMTELVEAIVAIGPAYDQINSLPIDQKLTLMQEALDNLIGDEEDAIIGPNGVIKFDVPFVGAEEASDLIIKGAVEYLKHKYANPVG